MDNLCDKEHSFKSHNDAHKQLRHMNSRKGRHQYRLYKCDKCGNYHITTVTKTLQPRKKQKYPLDIEKIGKVKEDNTPGMSAIPKQSKVEKTQIHTGKFMTKEQAAVLKQIIDNYQNK